MPPGEAAAGAAGGAPARLYTVEELEQAFLAGCDAGRLAGFDPLFEGGEKNPGSAALAARAALLPHLFLQALVRRALTGPLVPEVIE